ncbi:MAG: VCBS repeat-containing protein, partial [Verrucomicrobiae bacterium]|nr:VCBS repeat-containing protein [Verrucomicrobiae bacterium]
MALALALMTLSGCRRDPIPRADPVKPASAQVAASHRAMVDDLAAIATRVAEENDYLSDKPAIDMRAQLAAETPETPARLRFRTRFELGREELNLGREREAIEHLQAAYDLFPSTGLPEDALDVCVYFLAVSHLRLAETANCCRQPSADSCLYPIQGRGRHDDREGSEGALPWLEKFLTLPGAPQPQKMNAIWLLNVAHMTLGDYPDGVPERRRLPLYPANRPKPEPFPRFPNIAADAGADTFSLSGGAIADDFNGDGAIDLVVSVWDARENTRLFLNDGKGRFTDRTEAANLTGMMGGLNMKQADFDNDGDLDILVMRGAWLGKNGRHPNSLLRNEGVDSAGVPVFRDVAPLAGLTAANYPVLSGDWADFDNDGDLDLYLGNESNSDFRCPSQLFRNDGPSAPGGVNRFTDIAAEAGVRNFGLTKGVTWGDYDGDRLPDLYVSNFAGVNR